MTLSSDILLSREISKRIKISAICLLSLLTARSQNAQKKVRFELNFSDSYVIKVKVKHDSSVVNGKDHCAYKKGTKCFLYPINISQVLYSPRKGLDSAKLKNIKYMLVPKKKAESLIKNNELILTAFKTPSDNYLAFSRILPNIEPSLYEFFHRYALLVELTGCGILKKHPDKFDKYFIKSTSND